MPARNVELRAEDRRGCFSSGLNQFQHIPCFALLQWVQEPLIQNQKLRFLQLLHILPVSSVAPSHGNLNQQIRQADVLRVVEVPVRRHPQSAGKTCFSCTGDSQQDNVMCFLYVGTGCQAQDLGLVQLPVRQIFNIFYAGTGNGITCILYEAL